jgi:hypothetical protein
VSSQRKVETPNIVNLPKSRTEIRSAPMRHLPFTATLVGFVMWGCSRTPAPMSNAAPSEPSTAATEIAFEKATPAEDTAAAPPQVIVELVGRNETVQVLAGVRYSVLIGDRVVTNNVSAEELRITHPAIYQRLHKSYARPYGTFEWAGLNFSRR